jgi:hypothetical protein
MAATTEDKTATTGKDVATAPQWYKVRSSFPTDRKRVLFRSVSETRARQFVEKRFPRGEEAYLEMPDGTTLAYMAERQGEHGQDADAWGPFDPETWKPPEEQEPPGQSEWADVEA